FSIVTQLISGIFRILIAKVYLRNCTKIGSYVSVNKKPKISNLGSILLDDEVRIWSSIVKTQIYVGKNAILSVGKNSRLNGVHIDAKKEIIIGKNVRIAPNVLIMDS